MGSEDEGCFGCFVDKIDDWFKQLAGCLVCLLCVGPVFIVVGISFLASSVTDDRQVKIDEFKAAIDEWNAEGLAEAKSMAMYAEWDIVGPECSTSLSFLDPTTELEGDAHESEFPLNVENDVSVYEQYYFKVDIPSELINGMNTQELFCGIEASVYVVLGDKRRKLLQKISIGSSEVSALQQTRDIRQFGGSDLALDLPFSHQTDFAPYGVQEETYVCSTTDVNENRSSCQQKCYNKGGIPQGTSSDFKCMVTAYMDAMCGVVMVDEDESIVPSETYQGCFYSPETPSGMKPVTYSTDGDRAVLIVRHELDPILTAEKLTGGSMFFGFSTEQKLVIGAVFIVIGAVFMTFWIISCYFICKFCGKSDEDRPQPTGAVGKFYSKVASTYQYPNGAQFPPPPPPHYVHPPQALAPTSPYPPQHYGHPHQPHPQQPQVLNITVQSSGPSGPAPYPPQISPTGYPYQPYPQQPQVYATPYPYPGYGAPQPPAQQPTYPPGYPAYGPM